VYGVPLLSPGTVIGLMVPDAVIPPGSQLAVNPVIIEPPLPDGAANETAKEPLPTVAVPTLGADGGVL
jgi:hypothetical protein